MVVIACHNDGATLRQALDSVAAQEPCETVIVDDGSDEPETLAVLDGLENEGVRVIRQVRSGPGAARMRGVEESTAPYVFALDSDDLLPAGALVVLADALDANPAAAIAWGRVEPFGAASGPRPVPESLDPWLITYVDEFIGTGLIRREELLGVGGWRRGGSFENWDLLMALCERGARGVGVDRPMLLYRVRPNSRLREMEAAFEQIYEELRQRHEPLFARRRQAWRRSPAPLRSRLLFPAIDRLPVLSAHTRHRIAYVVHRPSALGRGIRRWLAGGPASSGGDAMAWGSLSGI
ncbi:MAG: glycosyltransferase family A protein [Solirubrobacterales bacterium]